MIHFFVFEIETTRLNLNIVDKGLITKKYKMQEIESHLLRANNFWKCSPFLSASEIFLSFDQFFALKIK